MVDFLLGLLVGAFVGWAIPQPQWAKNIVTRIRGN